MGENQIDKKITTANNRLKAAKIGIKIYRRGERLYLRGTLPPKNGEGKPRPQWLALKTYANYEGVAAAEKEAKKVGGLLACGEFSWKAYSDHQEPETIGDYLEQLRSQKIDRDGISPRTFDHEYARVFRGHLEEVASLGVLEKILLESESNTRNRRRFALACGALADVAGLNGGKLRKLKGDYGIKRLSPRDLPTDKAIALAWQRIYEADKQWAFVFGLMAIYGLRNHEVFHCDLKDYPLLWVSRGKTGERYVYPFYPEWLEDFKMREGTLPEVNRKDNQGYGQAVTKALGKYLDFPPYSLRHCWAVRTIGAIDQSLAAAQMGHAIAVHNETYHHWIKRDTHQKAFDLYLKNPNRPKPPILPKNEKE
uniref:hypothetical protein n=1 Tax=Picosynechococcus sp. PCC 8807 TaxID=195248 RepID=UPI00081063D1|nr:hypothetical protein [Picosynechococcus sp. PCC 8807]ANV92016.1 hypothetical protein AWQ24_14650 [Picosynechococcus sp. PCC 8807]